MELAQMRRLERLASLGTLPVMLLALFGFPHLHTWVRWIAASLGAVSSAGLLFLSRRRHQMPLSKGTEIEVSK
jgi:hypothetical protein